jgi:hypothetical protein
VLWYNVRPVQPEPGAVGCGDCRSCSSLSQHILRDTQAKGMTSSPSGRRRTRRGTPASTPQVSAERPARKLVRGGVIRLCLYQPPPTRAVQIPPCNPCLRPPACLIEAPTRGGASRFPLPPPGLPTTACRFAPRGMREPFCPRTELRVPALTRFRGLALMAALVEGAPPANLMEAQAVLDDLMGMLPDSCYCPITQEVRI